MAKSIEIYFHGIPGGRSELSLFKSDIRRCCQDLEVAQRSFRGPPDDDHRFERIAEDLRQRFPERSMRFVGFSLGAAVALRTAPFVGDQVEQIDLVSPAPPLQLGRYLDGMAGAPVFRAASRSTMSFDILSRAQSILARTVPAQLYGALFASAQGADRILREDPHFKRMMIDLLRDSVGRKLNTYRSEIRSYVRDWTSTLRQVEQPVFILHGRMDNWCPVQMAEDLARALPQCRSLRILEGHSHYSTLGAYLQDH